MNQIVAFAVKQRAFMVLLLLVTFVAGLLAFAKLDIEAYPDPIPPLVEVTTQSNGQSAAEVERYITIPIEMQLSGMPYVTRIDSTSLFGLSDIEVHFTYHYTYHEAEQRVIDRLSQLGPLPNGATPQISPESAIGEIYRYRIVGPPGYSVTDLKTIQDWIVKPRLLAIPGILGVGGWAGKTRTYAVTVDENKLLAYGLTIPQIVHALKNADLHQGRRRRHGRARAAPRHRRLWQRQRHRSGHRIDAARRQDPADAAPRRGRSQKDQYDRHSAARHQAGSIL